MNGLANITIYNDSIVYELEGGRSIHDFHGGGIISKESGDKICLKNSEEPCGALNFPMPNSEDQQVVAEFQASHPNYVDQILALARTFPNSILWQDRADGWREALITGNAGTIRLLDRNADCQVDKLEFTPNQNNPQNTLTIGLRILRDYYDPAFDHKEDRPVKNPLSVPYLDKIKAGDC